MILNIISSANRRIPRKRILDLMALIDEDEEPRDSSVNIIFIRDGKIRQLNRQFRNIDQTTDVLSFNIDNEPGEDNILGEIYISTDTAAKYAKKDDIGFYEMLVRLCCHGYLHLLGYDHEKKTDIEIMKSREKYYLEKAGICL